MRGEQWVRAVDHSYTNSHNELYETSGTVLFSSRVCPLTGGSVLDIL